LKKGRLKNLIRGFQTTFSLRITKNKQAYRPAQFRSTYFSLRQAHAMLPMQQIRLIDCWRLMATDSSETKEAGDIPYPQKSSPFQAAFLRYGM